MSNAPTKFFTKRSGTVFACIMGTFVNPTTTVNTVFGLFLIPISTEFGWPRSGVSGVLFVVAVTSALSFPIIGRLADRYGVRIIVLVGILLFAVAVALVSLTEASYLQFYLLYALVGITGSSLGQIPFTKVIAGWFDKNRGLFLGVVGGVGNGAGATFMPIFVHMLIANYGWRGAYQGIAIAIVLIGFPAMLFFLRDPPGSAGAEDAVESEEMIGLTLSEARKTSTFWMMLCAIALGAGCMTAVFTHVVPMLLDRGMSFDRATTVLTTFAMVTVAWQIGVGFLLDRIPKPRIIAPFYLVAIAGIWLLEITDSYPLLIISGALMGIGLGTEYGVLPYFITRYFGLRAYGAISGMMYATIILLLGTTPVLMDVVFDVTGSYRLAIAAISVGLLGGAVLLARLQPFESVLSQAGANPGATKAEPA